MDERLETVKIKRDTPRGFTIINKTDFDPARHELFDSELDTPKRSYKKRGES